MIADRTDVDVRYSHRPLAGIVEVRHEYLPIYNFKLKPVFDECQIFSRSLCFVAKRYIVQKKWLKMNKNCRPIARNTMIQL